MKYNKIIAILLAGIVIGWFLPHCHSGSISNSGGSGKLITIHDTLKVSEVKYKILPGTDYNIDSLINVINQFWEDSLKNTYGHGLFETKFTKTDSLGIRNYTISSRIPPDPELTLTVDEMIKFPKRIFGLIGSIGNSTSLGLKYYLHDTQKYSVTGQVGSEYLFATKGLNYYARFELEIKI